MSSFESMRKHIIAVLDYHVAGIKCAVLALEDAKTAKPEESSKHVYHAQKHIRDVRFLIPNIYEDMEARVEVYDGFVMTEQIIASGNYKSGDGWTVVTAFLAEIRVALEEYRDDTGVMYLAGNYLHMGLVPGVALEAHDHEQDEKLN